jgi:hypothetical protein
MILQNKEDIENLRMSYSDDDVFIIRGSDEKLTIPELLFFYDDQEELIIHRFIEGESK